jgi:hypothetical protein
MSLCREHQMNHAPTEHWETRRSHGAVYACVMATTVLAKIVSALTMQRENAATEALAFIINRHSAARLAFARLLAVGGTTVEVGRVATQFFAGSGGRPDLAVYGPAGELIGFVEAKFWAGLTDAQPVGYLEALGSQHGGLLVFVAPERRLRALRHEIGDRCRAADLPCEDDRGVWRVSGSVISFLSWTGILASLKEACAKVSDRPGVSDIEQLEGLCAAFESEGYIPMSPAELSGREEARRVVMLGGLVTRIADEAAFQGVVDKGGPSHGLDWGGRYVTLLQASPWFGVSYVQWLEFGRGPLWLNFGHNAVGRADDARHALAEWIRSDPPRAYEGADRRVHVPILIPPGGDEGCVVHAAVAQLRAIKEALRMGADPGVHPKAPDSRRYQ